MRYGKTSSDLHSEDVLLVSGWVLSTLARCTFRRYRKDLSKHPHRKSCKEVITAFHEYTWKSWICMKIMNVYKNHELWIYTLIHMKIMSGSLHCSPWLYSTNNISHHCSPWIHSTNNISRGRGMVTERRGRQRSRQGDLHGRFTGPNMSIWDMYRVKPWPK